MLQVDQTANRDQRVTLQELRDHEVVVQSLPQLFSADRNFFAETATTFEYLLQKHEHGVQQVGNQKGP